MEKGGRLVGCWGCGQDREGPLGSRASSYEVTPPAGRLSRGRPANRSKASMDAAADYRARPPPGTGVSARGGAQAVVDLAGDVSLETADDLGLGFPFCGAPLDVGAG